MNKLNTERLSQLVNEAKEKNLKNRLYLLYTLILFE